MHGTRVLVTGAAGFIGTNLVAQLVQRGATVRAVDSFITGHRHNVTPWQGDAEFIEGDVRDLALCRIACAGVDYVLHQAALGSVPRSMEDPLTTHDHNVNGTLNMLLAARDAGVRAFVFAASSSAYGETPELPKLESMPPHPLSPYAASKLAGETYCAVFHAAYGLPTVALRYFNVFGPHQDPNGPYAAVIPRFLAAIAAGERPVLFGDGEQTRDFTYIDNVVQANLRACTAPPAAHGQVFNIGSGTRISLNALTRRMLQLMDSPLEPDYGPPRAGDVRDSQADVTRARQLLGYDPTVDPLTGLTRLVAFTRGSRP